MTPTVEPKALDVRREIENAVSVACDSDHDATGWFEPGYGDSKSTYDRHITPVVDLIASHIDTLKQQREAAVRRADKLERRASKQGQEIASLKRSLDRKETATPEASTNTEDVLREYHLGYNDSRGHVFRVEDMAMDFASLRTRLTEKAADAGIDDLLRRLDAIARQSYDYGLPIGADDPENERLRETVRAWLREET